MTNYESDCGRFEYKVRIIHGKELWFAYLKGEENSFHEYGFAEPTRLDSYVEALWNNYIREMNSLFQEEVLK